VVKTRKRLDTAAAKLEEARAEGSDLVDALQTGVDKTRAKLEAAEKALHEFLQRETGGEAAPTEPGDAAQAAIEKAMAARAAEASLAPADKARQNLGKLEQRLEKSRAKLAESREAGDEEKILVALESTVQRLEAKVVEAREHLQQAEEA
jgi:electron transport complex protein RnfC